MWLPAKIVEDVREACKVFYVSRSVAKIWNDTRSKGDPLVFTGWYWAQGKREGGPFKSQSSCYRDAWYRLVIRKAPPALHAEAERFELDRIAEENKRLADARRLSHRSKRVNWTPANI